MRVQQATVNNCLLAACYLLARGRVAAVALVSSHTMLWPCHFVCLTQLGHAIHYQWGGRWVGCIPCWFHGNWQGIRRSKIDAELLKSGRRLLWVERRQWVLWTAAIGMMLVMTGPWLVGWWISLLLRPAWPVVNGLLDICGRRREKGN